MRLDRFQRHLALQTGWHSPLTKAYWHLTLGWCWGLRPSHNLHGHYTHEDRLTSGRFPLQNELHRMNLGTDGKRAWLAFHKCHRSARDIPIYPVAYLTGWGISDDSIWNSLVCHTWSAHHRLHIRNNRLRDLPIIIKEIQQGVMLFRKINCKNDDNFKTE